MNFNRSTSILLFIIIATSIVSCGPKKVETEAKHFSTVSRQCIPFNGGETVTFEFDTNKMVFTGTIKSVYFDNVRYMSDQNGFFKVQEDYYAKLERNLIFFETTSSPYFLKYFLEKSQGETGEWDILRVTIADGDYYSNELKVVVYETDDFNKGESFRFQAKKVLMGKTFNNVYYWSQEQRPFELYYTKEQGVIGFKLSSNEIWTIAQDTIQ